MCIARPIEHCSRGACPGGGTGRQDQSCCPDVVCVTFGKRNAPSVVIHVFLLRLLAVPLALTVVAGNVYYDHVAPPAGLLLSPVAALIACGLVLAGTSPWNAYPKAALCAGLLMLQDAGMKLYGGGDHDGEGQGLMTFLFFVGALLSLALLTGALRRNEQTRTVPIAGAIWLFLALLAGHLLLFGNLGLGLHGNPYVE